LIPQNLFVFANIKTYTSYHNKHQIMTTIIFRYNIIDSKVSYILGVEIKGSLYIHPPPGTY